MLEYFQSLVEEENGTLNSLDEKVVEVELDSFGVTMVLLEIDSEHPWLPNGSLQGADIENLTWDDIVRMIDENK